MPTLPPVIGFDHQHAVAPKTLTGSLGGKGAHLAEMATVLNLPVPHGFTITTEACGRALVQGTLDEIRPAVEAALARLEQQKGRRFGDPENPLLVSVRSGAPASMPGMMDTVLNVGTTPTTATGLVRRGGSADFGWDCYARLAAMFASSVLGVNTDINLHAGQLLAEISDPDARIAALDRYLAAHAPLPADPKAQLLAAISAVIYSWNSERAKTYRRIEGIADFPCTAVTVQSMVFGNMGANSGSGVAFTRDPATGAAQLVGDWLANAQGEDVVAGTHKTGTLQDLARTLPTAAAQLAQAAATLERHLGDMCDIEFTVENGALWLLQVRVGKRSPRAALRIAIDMANEPDIALDRRGAVTRVQKLLLDPPRAAPPLHSLLPAAKLYHGIGVSPGIGVGRACFDSDAVEEMVAAGDTAILLRQETSPSDIRGMAAAAAIVTATGGAMSHAAVVARGWGVPAVVGLQTLSITPDVVTLGDTKVSPGDWLSVDGSTGEIALQRVAYEFTPLPEVAILTAWAQDCDIDLAAPKLPQPAELEVTHVELDPPAAILVLLSIKGMTSLDALADIFFLPAPQLSTHIVALEAAGSVALAKRGYRLTPAGQTEAVALFNAQRASFSIEPLALLDEFDEINKNFKATVTAWQVDKNGAPNDHQDATYDATVIHRLQGIHGQVSDWLTGLAAVPLAPLFAARFARALRNLLAGDTGWLLSPRVDSYHSVWFELHEYLIRLAGRDRASEAASGRAV